MFGESDTPAESLGIFQIFDILNSKDGSVRTAGKCTCSSICARGGHAFTPLAQMEHVHTHSPAACMSGDACACAHLSMSQFQMAQGMVVGRDTRDPESKQLSRSNLFYSSWISTWHIKCFSSNNCNTFSCSSVTHESLQLRHGRESQVNSPPPQFLVFLTRRIEQHHIITSIEVSLFIQNWCNSFRSLVQL